MTGEANNASPIIRYRGLACYETGVGEPLFLLPYPHGFGRAPIVQEPLAVGLRELNQRVISFDPPGMFNTTRPAQVSMSEMLDCAEETLAALGVVGPFTLVGHSMGGFCAIAYALAHPERVKRLIIVGSLASASAIQRHHGLTYASYADKSLAPRVEMEQEDRHRPAPVRDVWPRTIFANRLDYRARLSEIRVPALICVGRHDPQAPVGCSEEIANGIPGARLVIFQRSGHNPFVEERDLFDQTLAEFLA